jgi:hypothetical protein
MSEREFVVWRTLATDHGQCSWTVTRDGTLYVNTRLGSKCTQIGGSSPEYLAGLILREINFENAPGDVD